MKGWLKGQWRWRQKRFRVFRLKRRDGSESCFYCHCRFEGTKSRQRTMDHRVPLSRGGTNAMANLVFACCACNRRKGDRSEAEFVASNWLYIRRLLVAEEGASVA